MQIIMGTGSRSMLTNPDAKGIYHILEQFLLQFHERESGGIWLVSGMAEGWDEAVAKVGLRNNIPYSVVLPTKNYGKYYWGRKSLLKVDRTASFDQLVAGASEVVYLEDIYGEPEWIKYGETSGPVQIIPGPNYILPQGPIHANMARNQVMVDKSDRAVVYDANSAGTKDAVMRLRMARKPFDIYPFTNRMFDPAKYTNKK